VHIKWHILNNPSELFASSLFSFTQNISRVLEIKFLELFQMRHAKFLLPMPLTEPFALITLKP
jgi:hypothetical protein